MLNVVVQTIVRAMMNAAAAAKTGLQLAASHSSNGEQQGNYPRLPWKENDKSAQCG
jgi:hypothetical protein